MSYIKERKLRGLTTKPLYILDGRPISNSRVLQYWKKYFRVIEGRWADRLLPLLQDKSMLDNLENYSAVMSGVAPCYAIETAWGDRPPLFKLAPEDEVRGVQALLEMGIPKDVWFVCIHSREGGYSPEDEHWHSFRNVNVESHRLAVEEIKKRGGWCIRMGDPTMKPLEPSERFIDYAHSPWKSDWMDVFLCARCKCFLGCSSGLFLLSSAFGVPSALTNMAPLGCAYSFCKGDLSIPQLLIDQDNRLIPFPAAFASDISNYRWAEQFSKTGITMLQNSPEDIRDLVVEMLDRIDGLSIYTDEDEARQNLFRSYLNDSHYSYGSAARIGNEFLKKHEALLLD